MVTDEDFMRLAIEAARRGIKKGEVPFGACLVKSRRVVVAVHNVSREGMDITAHAEMQAIREACRRLGTLDLSGCIMYATGEPCPMCFSACLWAKVPRIVYGSRIEDMEQAGIWQIPIDTSRMKQLSRGSMEIIGDVLREENLELFKTWMRTRP
jgi:tRNA(Arg) A34 adenosine deaminase TadA